MFFFKRYHIIFFDSLTTFALSLAVPLTTHISWVPSSSADSRAGSAGRSGRSSGAVPGTASGDTSPDATGDGAVPGGRRVVSALDKLSPQSHVQVQNYLVISSNEL